MSVCGRVGGWRGSWGVAAREAEDGNPNGPGTLPTFNLHGLQPVQLVLPLMLHCAGLLLVLLLCCAGGAADGPSPASRTWAGLWSCWPMRPAICT